MTATQPTYGVGQVIYPKVNMPTCAFCGDASERHRYTVKDAQHMVPSGCDGLHDGQPCACPKYVMLARGTDAQEAAWAKYPGDARTILSRYQAPDKRCSRDGCQVVVWWGVTAANQVRCLFDVRPDGTRTGTSHWRTCVDPPPRRPRAGKA